MHVCIVFTEFSDVMDRVATTAEPIYVIDYVNIRLDRTDDPWSRQFTELLTLYGLALHVSAPTHDRGGLLDVVASRVDLPTPFVDVINVGLSDHRLLRWTSAHQAATSVRRPWSRLDTEAFKADLLSSALCRPSDWSGLDVEQLARLYDTEMTSLLDRHVPARSVVCRRRQSDPCFDDECRAAKRLTRKLERAACRADPTDAAAATAANAAWTAQRLTYLALRRQKREQFWRCKVDAERSDLRQLRRSIDALLGRGRVPSCDAIGPTEFHRAFDGKVNGVRSLTADAPPPTFTPVKPGFSLSNFGH